MPQVEADLVIEIGKTQENLKKTIQLQTQIDTNNKKIAGNSSASFKKVSDNVNGANQSLQQGIGFLATLKQRIVELDQRRLFAPTREEAERLTREIKAAEFEVAKLEGRVQATGQRVQRGVSGMTNEVLSLGQGVVGAINLFSLLGSTGEKNNETLIKATRLLIIAESARQVILGAIQAKEFALFAVERLRAAFIPTAIVAKQAQAAGELIYSGALTKTIVTQQAATVSTLRLNAALLLNPYVLLAAGIAALITAIVLFDSASEDSAKERLKTLEKESEATQKLLAAQAELLASRNRLLVATGAISAAQAQQADIDTQFKNDEIKRQDEHQKERLKLQQQFEEKSFFLFGRAAGAAKIAAEKKLDEDLLALDTRFYIDKTRLQEGYENERKVLDITAKNEELARESAFQNLKISVNRNALERDIAFRLQKRDEELQKLLPGEKNFQQKEALIRQKAAQDIFDIREKFARQTIDILIKQQADEQALQNKVLESGALFLTNIENLERQQLKAREDLLAEQEKIIVARTREIQDSLRGTIPDEDIAKKVEEAVTKINNEFSKIFTNLDIADALQRQRTERANAQALLALQQDSLNKRLENERLAFATVAEELVKQGATEEQIEREKNRRINNLTRDFNLEQLELDHRIAQNELDTLLASGEFSTEAIKRINGEKLKVDIEYAESKLELIQLTAAAEGDTSKATLDAIKELEKRIAELKKKVKEGGESIEPIKWSDIFGISDAQAAEFNAGVESLIASAQSLISQGIQFRIDEQEKLLEINQTLIDDLNRRIDEEEQALQREEQLNRQGFANNVSAKRKEVDDLKAQRDRELQHQKQLLIEKQKLAKQQAIINAAEQGAALITAGATLFKVLSAGGPIGIGVAIGLIASMIAAFLSLKAQVASATTGFYEGGYTGDGSAGDVAGVTHKKEFVFDHKKTTEYRELFEKIHKDQPLTTKDLLPLLEGTGVVIPEDTKKEISQTQTQITEHKTKEPDELREIRNQLIEMNETVSAMQERMENSTESWTEPDGTTVLRTWKKGLERIKRIKKNV